MKKTIIQGSVIIVCFFSLFFLLSQIDYMKIFEVKNATDSTEEKLGEIFWESIERTETVIRNDSINKTIDKIITHITDKNGIDRESISVHIIEKDEINAFAMPGNHLVVYTGLISGCDNESELAGVLCHEIAHIQKNHVMKKLVKEVGLSVLISITTGGKSPQLIKETAKLLSSSAYDRELESEADITGVDYLIKAEMDPEQLANFLYKLSNAEFLPDAFYWVSTHPESKQRAKKIMGYIKKKDIVKKRLLTTEQWDFLKKRSGNDDDF